jgi:hypothetical protein
MDREDTKGAIAITGTTLTTGPFWAITALEATVLAAGTAWDDLLGGSVSALPIPVGTTIYGYFSAVQLTSGKVIAYVR